MTMDLRKVKKLIEDLSAENPKIPSNMLHALQSVHPSQLMDKKLWDFTRLQNEEALLTAECESNNYGFFEGA